MDVSIKLLKKYLCNILDGKSFFYFSILHIQVKTESWVLRSGLQGDSYVMAPL